MMVAVNTLLRYLLRHLLAVLMCAAATSQAAPPGFNDSIAQRTLACTACHGKEGRAGPTATTRASPASPPATCITSC
jgi:cytochrome c553